MQTHHFKVIIRPDEERWQADCPALQEHGAYTWGYTREEALGNILEVIGIILAELVGMACPFRGSRGTSLPSFPRKRESRRCLTSMRHYKAVPFGIPAYAGRTVAKGG